MSKYSNFQSLNELQSQRDEANEARGVILQKAKEKYEREERRKEKARKQGEGTWMLDAVSQRIQKEEWALEKTKKKKKKEKRRKKKKKEKNDSSSSSDEDNNKEQWIEVGSSERSADDASSQMKGPQLQREGWMEAPLDLLPSISRQEIRDAAQKKKDEAKREAEKLSAPGQHTRELNPYWKDGGTGLPEKLKQRSTSSSSSLALGDGGLSWLQKAYQRCKEQAKDEGRSLEDVVAERWGSLNHLKSLIEKAEKKLGKVRETTSRTKDGHERRERDSREDRHESKRGGRDRERRSDEATGRDRDGKLKRDPYRERDAYERDDYHREHTKEGDSRNRREWKQYEDERGNRRSRETNETRSSFLNSRAKFCYPRSDDDNDEGTDRKPSSSLLSSRFRKPDNEPDDNERSKGSRQSNFMRPSDDAQSVRTDKRKFKKPGGSDDDSPPPRSPERVSSRFRKKESSRETERESAWRKQSTDMPRWRRDQQGSDNRGRDGEREKSDSMRKSRKASTSSSSSSSCSSDEEQVQDNKERESEKEELSSDEGNAVSSTPAKILSEEELNDLAAKILRAEIMGEETLAAELKDKLENARRSRDAAKSGGEWADFAHRRKNVKSKLERETEDGGDDDNIVVLSRSNKSGMVRPVSGASEEWGRAGGRKQKRKNVTTHGDLGERKKFFHDDDKFDLKTLVEREKAGTAEDQNSMFARLAGRSGDRDLDVDDMFVSKAARNQEEEQASNRDKMAAIFEHRKISKAIEKCQRCFNKVPKHLIIAIGTKSYLCLPPHRSLTDGHCLIVPMAHLSSATSMDEDVWQEIQLFRKTLVQMFTAQDQDVVVMETVMHLKHFPHTAVECIPLEREVGDLAPIYFKKAIQDVGPEWSDNKKLHDISKKDIRHVVPKGFPYFSVDFGLQGGFAHVIEDESTFPNYFGREIVGGMLDAEPLLWRKPHKQSFEDQRQKILQFEKWWSPFDWTKDLNKDD